MSTWVLLRGLGRESRHWGNFPEVLRREILRAGVPEMTDSPLQIMTPDLPGNGRLNSRPSPPHVEEMAGQVRADLLARGVAPPYHLLAMSLGAMVAVAWAQAHPEEISAAVLINTSLRPFSPFYHRLRPENYLRLLGLIALHRSDQAWENAIHEITSRHPEQRAETVCQWLALRREYPVSRRNLVRQLLAAARFQAPPEKPPVPLLVLGSRNDALVNCTCSRQLARRWHSDYVEHPAAGHDLPLDDGSWVARTLMKWRANRSV